MHTRFTAIGAAMAMALTTMAAAQSTQSTTSREMISATGCVRLAGADDSTGESLGTGFLLTSVRVAPQADTVETRASGDLTTRRDPGLLLVADRGVDLAEHVGHRVLVTGRLSSFAAPDGIASTSSGRTLTVTRVSLIAPACTTGS